ncbi:hypothetical protein N9Z93_04005 [Akkermansiaceae bacterium]|nr:hypothetical protein [Akkermansiaceae bacterium]
MYSAQIRSSRTFRQKQIPSSMKPRYLVSVFLISGLVSGCVYDGPGAFPRPFWQKKGMSHMYGMPSLPSPRVYSGWSDQKKMTFQDPANRRGYSGPHISYSNGHKALEGTYKDGKWEGLWTGWHHENGQKKFEGTYKKGKKVSAKYWNIEGIEVENLDEAEDYPMGGGL